MSDRPLVTVVVPVLDEQDLIGECLARVSAQDYDHARIEVVVVDGGSEDDTRGRAQRALDGHGFARTAVVENQPGDRSNNLNRGLAEARGEYLVRVDARSRIPRDYVTRAVGLLTARPDIGVVGGGQVAQPGGEGVWAAAIGRALNNRWGMGLARYRRASSSGPADTVYLGVFRTEDVRAVGGWSRQLVVNEDFDLNRRLAERGRVWFDPALSVDYLARSRVSDVFQQYRSFGRWKVRYWRQTGDRPQPRQWLLLAGPPAAVLSGGGLVVFAGRSTVAAALAAAALGAGAVEVFGNRARATLPVHLCAVVVLAAVATGWLSGIYTELVSPGPASIVESSSRRLATRRP